MQPVLFSSGGGLCPLCRAVPSPGKVEPATTGEHPLALPPGVVKALRVFKAHFPMLLKKHPNRWVACDGERVLDGGGSHDSLDRRCPDRGLAETEFLDLYMLPDAAEYID